MSIELISVALLLAAGGIVMGLLAGLFGISGGSIVVPILYELFRLEGVPEEIRMHMSVGTSLAILIPTTARSALAHSAKGSLDHGVVRRFAPPVLLGALLAALVAKMAPSLLFKIIWVCFASAMAVKLLLGENTWQLGRDLPKSRWIEFYAIFVGLISTLLSIGGGLFVSMLLNLYGKPLIKAVGTPSGVGPWIAIPGTLGFIWAGWQHANLPGVALGFVSPLAALIAIPTSVLAAPFGVKLAHRIPKRHLEIAMALFYSIIALRFAVALLR